MSSIDDDITLKMLAGSAIFIDDVFAFFPPTIQQIINVGYSNVMKYLSMFLVEKPSGSEELAELFKNFTDYQFFIYLGLSDEKLNATIKEAFYFFTHEKIFFSGDPAKIVVDNRQAQNIINEDQFCRFRSYLKRFFLLEHSAEDDIVINENDDDRTRAIKMKLIERRKLLAKAKRSNDKSSSNMKFSDLIASIPFGQCNLNITSVMNLTYYAFQDQLKRMGWHEQYDINSRAALAGAKIDKAQLQHWMKGMSDA